MEGELAGNRGASFVEDKAGSKDVGGRARRIWEEAFGCEWQKGG
jgi:hypothetical protein